MNEHRKLASVQRVISLKHIENADRIESVGVLGWECVASKGDFKVGELCIYFELDSYLPIRPEFEVLRTNSYKNTETMGEGFRIKTQTFRGKLSQGFICKLDILPQGNYIEGQDVSEQLGVREFERAEELDTFGTLVGSLPAFLKRTEEFRVQSFPLVIEELKGKGYYITNKIDGTSVTVFNHHGEIGICGHDNLYKTESFKYLNELKHVLDVIQNNPGIAIQGELAGPGICKNRAGFKEVCFNVFNIMDCETQQIVGMDKLVEFCKQNNLRMVEIDEIGDNFSYTVEELIAKADGVYKETGKRREGIVIRPLISIRSDVLMRRLSFKVINNKYLLKNGD